MVPGDVVDGRFALDTHAASGGMGTVFRARDLETGALVALKLLRDPDTSEIRRFVHEAQILEKLHHPHVVRHVAHGVLPSNEPWLAMEWLEGEDLSKRLSKGSLATEEAIPLVRLVAEALGAAHARSVVHRDIKPSNIFLVDGKIERAKILDFGIARHPTDTSTRLTATNTLLGTPGYMAPEQVRGERDISPAADMFSLGCVLFECISGKPAFQGAHLMAILATLLFEDPPRLADIRPNIPRALSDLCARMLSKNAAERPRHGAELAQELATLTASPLALASSLTSEANPTAPKPRIGTVERRLFSLLAILPASPITSETPSSKTSSPWDPVSSLQSVVEPLGGKAEALADGTILVVLAGEASPKDQAARSARAALRIQSLLPDANIVLVTGRGEMHERMPVGDVAGRAATILDRTGARTGARLPAIVIDDITRALLDPRFEVIEAGDVLHLVRERVLGEEGRTLLGKPSPFVGRDRELRSLLDLLEEGFEERAARAVLCTANAGMGKSRLRQELSRRLRERVPEASLIVGRADSIGQGATFGLLASGLRSAWSIESGEPLDIQRGKLSAAIGALFEGDAAARVAEFLGELVGTPFPDEKSPRLRTARQNRHLMAEQIEAAFLDFMRATTRTRPALVVLEDLHWGDSPSVGLLEVALRELGREPLAVLAFARPEVQDRFPHLWASRDLQVMSLAPLPRKAAAAMTRAALGSNLDPARIDAIVERSEGNAFFLEELIRAVAEGHGDALPETVLGMVEARLSGLPAEARRVLRVASIFGEIFWKNAVKALFEDVGSTFVDETLAFLVRLEVLTPRRERRFSGEDELAFRHALVREGAYAMLTEGDRQAGHALAGDWLERAGETDAIALAEHFERGGERRRAAVWHAKAAVRALPGSDMQTALAAVERGLAAEPDAETEAILWGVRAQAAFTANKHELTYRAADETMKRAPSGSSWYCRALGVGLVSAAVESRHDIIALFMSRLLDVEPRPDEPGAIAATAAAFAHAIYVLIHAAQREAAARYFSRLRELGAQFEGRDPLIAGCIAASHTNWTRTMERDYFASLVSGREAERHFLAAGEPHFAANLAAAQAMDLMLLGAFEEVAALVERIRARARPGSTVTALMVVPHTLMLLARGAIDEALEAARILVESRAPIQAILGYYLRAEAHLSRGEVDASEAALKSTAEKRTGNFVVDRWSPQIAAKIALARGKAGEAADLATKAMARDRADGIFHFRHSENLVIRAEALMAAGDEEAARVAIREAREDMLGLASKILEPGYRKSFLECVSWNARTSQLAREWLGEE